MYGEWLSEIGGDLVYRRLILKLLSMRPPQVQKPRQSKELQQTMQPLLKQTDKML